MLKQWRIITTLLSLVFITGSVHAATFKMKFFDNNAKGVGSGQFSFVNGSYSCVEFDPGGNCNDPSSENVMQVANKLTHFSAIIQHQSWGLDHKAWWAANGQSPGWQYYGRYGYMINSDWWFFGDDAGDYQLVIDISQATDRLGVGTWFQQIILDNGDYFEGSGTWQASLAPVPVPAAVWLFIFGIGILSWMAIRPSKLKSCNGIVN